MSPDEIRELAFSHGYDAGNYTNAYATNAELMDGALLHARPLEPSLGTPPDGPAYMAGFVLGFYSSYEQWEVPGQDLDYLRAALAYASWHGLEDGRDEPPFGGPDGCSRKVYEAAHQRMCRLLVETPEPGETMVTCDWLRPHVKWAISRGAGIAAHGTGRVEWFSGREATVDACPGGVIVTFNTGLVTVCTEEQLGHVLLAISHRIDRELPEEG